MESSGLKSAGRQLIRAEIQESQSAWGLVLFEDYELLTDIIWLIQPMKDETLT